MAELHLPWLELSICLALLGAFAAGFSRTRELARTRCIAFCGLVFFCTVCEWLDFVSLHTFEAHDHWDVLGWLAHGDVFVVDELSAPLLPLAGLLYLMVILSTQRTKSGRFSFGWAMVGEAIILATLSCRRPWMIIALMAVSCVPPWLELRRRGQSTRVFALHMGLSTLALLLGWLWIDMTMPVEMHANLAAFKANGFAVGLLAIGALMRSGVVPVHCWMTDLFEKATFGTALLFVTPLTGAYVVMRLILPIAPQWSLECIAVMSLITAVYAAGMALVQTEARRFFCYLLLSHASLVLVGLELATPIGLTGGLCVWLSVGLSLAGFGITLRCVESRIGRISLSQYHGLYEQMPTLAGLFLLTGLSSIGFPGTVGFIGMELLTEGAVAISAWVGGIVVFAAALNGIAIVHGYFRVFTGCRHVSAVPLFARPSERIAVIVFAGLILGGGLIPQPGVGSRYHAAVKLLESRNGQATELPTDTHSHAATQANGAFETRPAIGSNQIARNEEQ